MERWYLAEGLFVVKEIREKRERDNWVGLKMVKRERRGKNFLKYLDFEVIGLLVVAFGHVDRDELKVNVFLEETGQDS